MQFSDWLSCSQCCHFLEDDSIIMVLITATMTMMMIIMAILTLIFMMMMSEGVIKYSYYLSIFLLAVDSKKYLSHPSLVTIVMIIELLHFIYIYITFHYFFISQCQRLAWSVPLTNQ